MAHGLSGVISSADSKWSIPTAVSILKEGDTDLNEYQASFEENDYRALVEINGRYYTFFPIGASLIALPFVFVIDGAFRIVFALFPALEEWLRQRCSMPVEHINVITVYWRVEHLIASIVVAATAVFVYLTARESLDKSRSLLIAMLFAFCTSAWSIGSRALWQHGPSAMLLALALYLLVLAEHEPRTAQYASLPLAFAYVVRPTNGIPIVLLTAYVLLQHRRHFLQYLLWSLPIAIPFIAFNLCVYHWPVPPYYSPGRLGSNPHYFEALAANLVSPARGLLIYSPVFVFSLAGIAMKWKRGRCERLDYFLMVWLVLHWLTVSSFGDWWAGHSFGPRYFTDLTPVFVYFLIPVVKHMSELRGWRKAAFSTAFIVCVAASGFIHYRGATSLDTWAWNREPVDINAQPSRVWNWRAPPFLRD